MTRHHPDTLLLTDFAAGSLPFGQSLCVAVHQESCQQCKDQIDRLNQLGANLMAKMEPAPVGDDLLDSILARLDEAEPAADTAPRRAAAPGVPQPLAKLIPGGFDALDWKRLTSSLHSVTLPVGDDGNQVSLIRMRAGGEIGKHYHAGNELTVVLRGGFSDRSGVYDAGDFVALGVDDMHRPVAHQNEDCICLAAQDGPIRFPGLKGMLLNRFIGIQAGSQAVFQ